LGILQGLQNVFIWKWTVFTVSLQKNDMRIDDNSFYLRYFNNAKRGESADLVYYKKVWEDGYTIDEYNIDENGISYEDADWSGVNTDDSRAGTRILRRHYDRWVKTIEEARTKIEKLVTSHNTLFNRKIMIGDCLYIPWKKILEEEDTAEREELGDNYEEDEDKYEGPNFRILYVTGINQSEIEGYSIIIDRYDSWYSSYPRTYNLDYLDRAIVIPKEVYEEAKTILKTIAATLLSEMKQKVRTIEIK